MNADDLQQITALEAQERRLVFTRFDNADAWRLGSAMVAAATERSLPVTIDIRRHGHQLFHVAYAEHHAGERRVDRAQGERRQPVRGSVMSRGPPARGERDCAR